MDTAVHASRERKAKAEGAEADAVVSKAYAKEARAAQSRGRERSSIPGAANRRPGGRRG
jgi:hypothetical protein